MTDEHTPAGPPPDEPVAGDAQSEPVRIDEPAEDPGLTGWLSALRMPRHDAAQTDDSGGAATESEPLENAAPDAAETTVLPLSDTGPVMGAIAAFDDAVAIEAPSIEPLSDAEAAALAASTIPAATAALGQAVPAAALGETAIDLGVPAGVDMGPEKRTRVWLWSGIAVLVAAIIGGALYGWWWQTSRPIRVPDVVGKQPAEATQIFNDVALRLGDVSEIPTDSAPAGTIVSQTPEAGTELKPGQPVSFAVSTEPTHTHVPGVAGRMSEDAQTELARARLRSVVVESFAATAATGFVVEQLPQAGIQLPHGSTVVLIVSKGPVPATASVPKLVGLPESDANKLLKASALRIAIYRSFNASVSAGIVATQSPLPGVAAPYDSVVQVLVSQGAGVAPVVVPSVTGQSKTAAVKELKARGLKTESRSVTHPTAAAGQVLSQMPLGGTRAVTGGVVGLLVSRGNLSLANVPSLVGTASAGASEAIKAAGFRVVMVNVSTSDYTSGTVFMQFPAPATSYTRGFPMVCLVAAAPR